MLRTMRSPMPAASAASAGIAFFTSVEAATSAWRVIAPMVTFLLSTLMPERPLMVPRSTTVEGLDSRNFIVATRLCPPASSLASESLAMIFAASSTDFAFWYSNEYMFFSLGSLLACAPDPLRRRGHFEVPRAERVGERVHHRGGSADGAGLAAALHAQRVVRARRLLGADLEGRDVVGARHSVVHVGPGHELARLAVVMAALGQRLADALGEPAVHLAFDDHRVDDLAEVVDRGEVHDPDVAGVGVDLDLADMASGREGEVRRVVEGVLVQPRFELVQGVVVGYIRCQRYLGKGLLLVGALHDESAVPKLDVGLRGLHQV